MIGVHAPEFGFEKERANVENAVRELKITYPVAIDSNHRIWQAFNNEYWPADYFIDGKGRIRYHHFGEGEYGESEHVIQQLLKENGATGLNAGRSHIHWWSRGSAQRRCAISRNLCRLSSGRAFRIARASGSRLTKDLQPTCDTLFESMGIERIVERRR